MTQLELEAEVVRLREQLSHRDALEEARQKSWKTIGKSARFSAAILAVGGVCLGVAALALYVANMNAIAPMALGLSLLFSMSSSPLNLLASALKEPVVVR
jgi:hypothetical protein